MLKQLLEQPGVNVSSRGFTAGPWLAIKSSQIEAKQDCSGAKQIRRFTRERSTWLMPQRFGFWSCRYSCAGAHST
jgi:hypothetical protein